MALARPKLDAISASLPPGYKIEVGGEEEKQVDGFQQLSIVLLTSVAAIFVALTFQFKNAVKPFIVFAAVPFGSVGALLALWIMGAPFGFMGFLGVISLVGVIVTAGIVQLFVSNDQTYTLLTGQARMQESARFALDFISRSARDAGRWSSG